jgi:hypothetical protein
MKKPSVSNIAGMLSRTIMGFMTELMVASSSPARMTPLM